MFKFNLQNSYDKVRFFTLLQFLFVLIAFVAESTDTRNVLNFSFLFQLIILFFAYNFYYSALSNLYYSFWSMSFGFAIYYGLSIMRNFLIMNSPIVAILFLLSSVLLIFSCYIISSPLYFPRFHWWEYDFRYRADIRCWIEVDGEQFRGRISDLRRGAACLELFKSVSVGHLLLINVKLLDQNYSLQAEVRSKREPIIGRSFIYGIKFLNSDLEQKQRLKFLSHFWTESKKIKIRNKFAIELKS